MTSLSRKITFPPGWPGEPLDRRIALGRAALALERINEGFDLMKKGESIRSVVLY